MRGLLNGYKALSSASAIEKLGVVKVLIVNLDEATWVPAGGSVPFVDLEPE